MSVGYVVDQMQVNQQAGSLSRTIETWSSSVLAFKAYLDATPDTTLTSPPFSFTENDVAVLKSAFNDLGQLAQIYQGNATVDTAKDFGEFSRQMAGLIV